MKFGYINATPEQLWRWFTCKVGKEECSLELKLINADDYAKIPQDVRGDVLKYRAYVAEHLCRDFRNVTDANGTDVPNTQATRIEVLKHFDVWAFVAGKLLQASEQDVEGKGDSGSGS